MADKPSRITVTARPARGFRRARRHWPPAPTTVDAAQFTGEQLGALRAEPNLVVTETGKDEDQAASKNNKSGT